MFSTFCKSHQSALLFVMILLAAMVAPASAGRGSASEAVDIADSHSKFLTSQTFDKEVKQGSGDWVVVYCDDAAKPCKHMIDSFRHLTTIWAGTGQFTEASFGEIQCDQDKDVCEQQAVTVVPAAIHYRNGVRMATWTVDSKDVSMVRDFVGWVKNEITPVLITDTVLDAAGPGSETHATSAFDFSAPFAGMDQETAAIGGCLFLGAIAVVGWVLVEGFELWPAASEKKVGSM